MKRVPKRGAIQKEAPCWCCGWPVDWLVEDWRVLPRCDRCRIECLAPSRTQVTLCGLVAVYQQCQCGHRPAAHRKGKPWPCRDCDCPAWSLFAGRNRVFKHAQMAARFPQ